MISSKQKYWVNVGLAKEVSKVRNALDYYLTKTLLQRGLLGVCDWVVDARGGDVNDC